MLKCGYDKPQTEFDCYVADLSTEISCCLVNYKNGTDSTCALVPWKHKPYLKNYTDANFVCSTSSSYVKFHVAAILASIYMILF